MTKRLGALSLGVVVCLALGGAVVLGLGSTPEVVVPEIQWVQSQAAPSPGVESMAPPSAAVDDFPSAVEVGAVDPGAWAESFSVRVGENAAWCGGEIETIGCSEDACAVHVDQSLITQFLKRPVQLLERAAVAWGAPPALDRCATSTASVGLLLPSPDDSTCFVVGMGGLVDDPAERAALCAATRL